MFLRRLHQTRNGRTSTYYSLVETFRSPTGAVRQRVICYRGRLDPLRPPDWLRIAERLPDPSWLPRLQAEVGYLPPSPGGTVATGAVIPESISWQNPRCFGDGDVALRAWQLLGLDRLRHRLVGHVRTRVPMAGIATLSAVNRLVDPRSERGIFRWLPRTALSELLGYAPTRLTLNHLYRCLSLVAPHKAAVEKHLADQGRDLFHFRNDLLLYDLPSTYVEGRLERNPKAQRGYARDHRGDGKQWCIGLAVNRDGFPLGGGARAGNCRDAPTRLPLRTAREGRFGTSQRLSCFDRGMATEANRRELRRSNRRYVCATRRSVVREQLPIIRSGLWIVVQATQPQEPRIEGHELPVQPQDGGDERWLLCRRAGCRRKEQQRCDARLLQARQRLAKLQQQVEASTFVTRAVLLAKAKQAVGRTHDLRGVFTCTVEETPAGQHLPIQENAAALQDERALQGV